MWNSSQGGGFMSNVNNSPSTQGGNQEGRAKKPQNVVPVYISEVLNAPEEGFTVEGFDVGMIQVVGRVTNIEKATTKNTYQMEDHTGSVDVIQWMEEGSNEPELPTGSYIKVLGSMRTQGEKRHIMAFRIMDVPSQEERDCHILQVVYSHLKLKQLNEKMTGGGGSSMDHSGLSNSMMGSVIGTSFGGGTSTTSSSASFGNKNYDTVYALIRSSNDPNGINVGSIFNAVQGKMSKGEMDAAVEFLSNEGHIYSTVDDEHFKTTDCD